MTKKETCLIIVFCAVLLALSGVILVRFYHRVSDSYVLSEAEQIPLAGYTYTTAEGAPSGSGDTGSSTVRKTFTHDVYTPDADKLTTVTVTVTGSMASDSFGISHISTAVEEETPVLTVSEHLFGETATVVLYVNQISVCHFQYRLSPEGSIDPVK